MRALMRPDALVHRSDVVPDVAGGVRRVVAVLALEAVLLRVCRADVRLEGVQLGCGVVALKHRTFKLKHLLLFLKYKFTLLINRNNCIRKWVRIN